MMRIKDIAKFKGIIMVLGVVLATAIVGLPMVTQFDRADAKIEAQNDDSTESIEYVASFEALTPSPIFQDASTIYFVLDEILLVEEVNLSFEFEVFEVFAEDFTRILFNFIIAPNAP